MSEKTEQPTDKKKREARKQGQVARSRALTSALSGVVALSVAGATLAGSSRETLAYVRGALLDAVALRRSPAQALLLALGQLAALSLPALLAAMVVGTGASALQVGLELNLEAAAPKLERLDPAQGLKKLFSPNNLVEVARSLLALLVVFALARSAVRDALGDLARLPALDGAATMLFALGLVKAIAGKAAFALLVLGGLDFLYQRHQHNQSLMMTKEEVKQEHKNSEGDPHHKAKRKRMHKELLASAGLKGVRGATAVVVNPTHVAVALVYDTRLSEAPLIAARGTEEEALRIRQEARRWSVPIVKDIPLARALVKFEVGEEVPEELYQAVAGVLKVVFEQQNQEVAP